MSRQSGERFRFLAESMPQIIFTARTDGPWITSTSTGPSSPACPPS